MNDSLLGLLCDADDLSSSIYDVAAVALHDGPNRQACLQWLMESRNADGSWGEVLSWQDRYLCTYSAAIATFAGGQTRVARASLHKLAEIEDQFPDNPTANFGGLVKAIDWYASRQLGMTVHHPQKVQQAMASDERKWRAIANDDVFYDPLRSIAGFFAEWAYILGTIDCERLLRNFQVANGSISNSPSASAFLLMACQERRMFRTLPSPLVDLKTYIERLNPYVKEVGILDCVPHFVTAWLLLYIDHAAGEILPQTKSVRTLRAALTRRGQLVSVAGDSTFPGDVDTTACAIIGLNLPANDRAQIMTAFEDMFCSDHYLTFRYERTPAVTTNVHAVAAWPENPHVSSILDWISHEVAGAGDLPRCKWHSSPFYTLGEIARLFADISHPQAQTLACHAGQVLLNYQHSNGSWGWQGSTIQETSCAVLALDKLRRNKLVETNSASDAIIRAGGYLSTGATDYRRLWIGKSLYYLKPLERWLRQRALSVALQDAPPPPNPLSVLYVDDNPSWRRIFETMLVYYDWQVALAEDAESALAHLQDQVPDIVVMDLVLPKMTGYQAFQTIRQRNLPCKVVATTAYYSGNTAEEVREMGFDGYLEKPFSAPTIADYLVKFANQRQISL